MDSVEKGEGSSSSSSHYTRSHPSASASPAIHLTRSSSTNGHPHPNTRPAVPRALSSSAAAAAGAAGAPPLSPLPAIDGIGIGIGLGPASATTSGTNTASTSAGPAAAAAAPPPYSYRHLPHTPSVSRPSSPPLPLNTSSSSHHHNQHHHHSKTASGSGAGFTLGPEPGMFMVNLGRSGGIHTFRIPILLQRVLAIVIRKWRSLLFLAIVGSLTTFGLYGAFWTEWREMTYLRVDPFPLVPEGAQSPYHAAAPLPPVGAPGAVIDPNAPAIGPGSATTKPQRPIIPPDIQGRCPGPKGTPIPLSPAKTYKTPPNHPLPIVGSHLLSELNPEQCITYRDRYGMYSDLALGITYRVEPLNSEAAIRKKKEALFDPEDPENLVPKLPLDAAAQAAAQAESELELGVAGPADPDAAKFGTIPPGSSSSSTTSNNASSIPDFDPLMGPPKPHGLPDHDWENHLRDQMWSINERAERALADGVQTFPDWRALMDACFEQRERERGRGGGVDLFDAAAMPITQEQGGGPGAGVHLPPAGGAGAEKDPVKAAVAGSASAGGAGGVSGGHGGTGAGNGAGGSGAGKEDFKAKTKFSTTPQTKRTALVMRSYEGYPWREDDILNLRAIISELSLNNPNTPYDIRILVEVKGKHLAVFTSEWDRLKVLRSSVPREFWGLVELWTQDEMCALYPGLEGKFLNGMFPQHTYRACLMALQKFYLDHPEYDYVYNWEMDVRYIGNYLDFLEGIEGYSRKEPLHVGMDKYDTWFVRNVTVSENNWADNTTMHTGRGEEADLITLGPIFDPRASGWFWEYDIQNYPLGQATDRRASIGTNMRMSRALLEAMNVVTAEAKKSTHCEAWPTTLVLHSQLEISRDHSFYPEAGFTYSLPLPFKGVFAPHPVYFRHEWDPDVLHARINRQDFYKKMNEKVMRDTSFYYDGKHSKEIYMGWKQRDNVCRAPALLHPIKRVN
ncbi:unnamed protein product [Tilletia laevis]|uniref:Uncharacterized protein n=3 Tax=Tilletia TaxID=13289 RepID=A0A8X7T019_9BASI|nr:hypothetical protein CF336_g574 [Tilletia laevis]KAE8254313.1 hypothetical protein A4X06_0g960 [Tilletia controversa]KAE8265322.1 hypothetical protein A4X03_0g345 [Tilletia caries]KAE8208636.1 hypothetical protein CF335_g270 [Tilletia laevis]CAD6890361.1 unnamed protein product [Tilletia caries]